METLKLMLKILYEIAEAEPSNYRNYAVMAKALQRKARTTLAKIEKEYLTN